MNALSEGEHNIQRAIEQCVNARTKLAALQNDQITPDYTELTQMIVAAKGAIARVSRDYESDVRTGLLSPYSSYEIDIESLDTDEFRR